MTWGASALLMCDIFYHKMYCTISPCCDYTLNNNNEIYMGITFVFCTKSAGHNAGICMGNARGTQLGVYIPYMRYVICIGIHGLHTAIQIIWTSGICCF